MPDSVHDTAEIKETDIVFDCPHCGKSLAIDYRGAGLTIPCTDCGKDVAVPIPSGMQLTDIDSSDEEQEIRILNLRRSLSASQLRIEHLESEIEELMARRDSLEKVRSGNLQRFGSIQAQVKTVEHALKEITEALSAIGESTREV